MGKLKEVAEKIAEGEEKDYPEENINKAPEDREDKEEE